MAWIEIGVWWSPERGEKCDHYQVVLLHPFVSRQPDGTWDVGWQPIGWTDLYPIPF